MANDDNVIVIPETGNIPASYNCKGKTDVYFPFKGSSFEDGVFVKSDAKNTTLNITIKVGSSEDMTISFKNFDSIKNVYCVSDDSTKEAGYIFPDDYSTAVSYYDFVIKNLTVYNEDKKTLTGTSFNDKLNLGGEYSGGLTINAGKGNDEIKGTADADVISGGTGDNIIYFSGGEDVINLTKGENLIIDVRGNLVNGFYRVGNDLFASINGVDSLKFKNFVKSNSVGSKGSVYLYTGDYIDEETGELVPELLDLNKDAILNFDVDSEELKVKVRKSTASLKGTRLGDYIDIDASMIQPEDEDYETEDDIYYKVTIKAGEGDNVVSLSSAENKSSVSSGSGKDVIVVEDCSAKISVNAGNGNNSVTMSGVSGDNSVKSGSGSDDIYLINTSTWEEDEDTEKLIKHMTTVNAGSGENNIYVEGSGHNTVITGKNNDTFYFNEGEYSTSVKAGGGENTIHITGNKFGEIVLNDEKIKKTVNNIVFDKYVDDEDVDVDDENVAETDRLPLEEFAFIKNGNDLLIQSADGTEKLTVKEQFSTGSKNSIKTYNGETFVDFMNNNNLNLYVTGSGTVKGTDLNEEIFTEDSAIGYEGKEKNDKIYSAKGNDTINAGIGMNSIYVYEGDGIDTVLHGGGTDTIIFKKNTKVNLGFAETGNVTGTGEEIYDLCIYYSKDRKDYVKIEGAITFDGETYKFDKNVTSVDAIKVGSKTYKLESLINRNKIENQMTDGNVVGTEKHDDIYVTDTSKFKGGAEVTINGNSGNDYIMIGSNPESEEASNKYNVDPDKYACVDIVPTVYTHATDGEKDTDTGTYDKVIAYATQGGKYYAQSAISDIKVYGTGTSDSYYTSYDNQYTKIYDESGEDTLYISDKSHDDLKLIFDISKDYDMNWSATMNEYFDDDGVIIEEFKADLVGLLSDNVLQEVRILTGDDRDKFLLNTDENNDMGLGIDYWGDKAFHDGEDESDEFDEKTEALIALGKEKLAGFGGGVEKIYASDGYYITSQKIAEIADAVAGWLTDNEFDDFDSVKDVFGEKGSPEAQTALLSIFDEALEGAWINGNIS